MKTLGWIGTVTSVLGSFTIAFGLMLQGYSLFMVGAACWLTVAIRDKNWSLLTLNCFFLCANIIGLVRALL